jgi:hypothetical protein
VASTPRLLPAALLTGWLECRAVPEPEAINCLCGTVKIQSAGLLKLKQAQKKGKK